MLVGKLSPTKTPGGGIASDLLSKRLVTEQEKIAPEGVRLAVT